MTHVYPRMLPVAAIVLLVFAGLGHAESTRELDWSDLVPPVESYEDPFLALSAQQILQLSLVATIRDCVSANRPVVAEEVQEERDAVAALTEQGIDVDGLLARRGEIKAKRQAVAEATDTSLNGQRIRMPGYVLPLDFVDKRVTEFLLVPYVGACIHVPPPPPNQIVHVTMESGFKSSGLYEPVWVEGRMTVGKSDHKLFLKDGSAAIPTGYSVRAVAVVPYGS